MGGIKNRLWREPQNADQRGGVEVRALCRGFVNNGNTLCMPRVLSMQSLYVCQRI